MIERTRFKWLSDNVKCKKCGNVHEVTFAYLSRDTNIHQFVCPNCGNELEFEVERNFLGKTKVVRYEESAEILGLMMVSIEKPDSTDEDHGYHTGGAPD